ncbi:MAG: hypothetical protein MUP63_00615 [Candidatus Nanohaloarchaeota archaeon QJJ-7]|nr:hypothetical protein [Candidatus Nanohaloarchaeota archaeon QJJ-7]
MRSAQQTDQGRSTPEYHVDENDKVLRREDFIYGEGLDDLMEVFRALPNMLEELGFDNVSEFYTEHWETLPFKTYFNAYRWKDPYTAIRFRMGVRVKEPRSDRKTDEDVYKAKLSLTAYLVKTKYPKWGKFEQTTAFKRSWFYKTIWKLLYNEFLFGKEQKKYEEEAEELANELMSRVREVEGSVPAIGKSKREWYEPEDDRR